MKKLIIAAATIAVAVVANATSVSWSTMNFYEVGSSEVKAGNTYTAYFVNAADLARDTMISTYVTTPGPEGTAGTINLSFLETTSAAAGYSATFGVDAEGAGTGKTGSITWYSTEETLKSVPFSGYLVVINATDVADATKAFVTTVTTGSTGANGQNKTLAFTGAPTSGAKTSVAADWYKVVPEPTSGLLMLLGMAGLALRRRRA